MIKMLMAGIED